MMIAAIPHARGFPIDGLMADLAMRLKRRGLRLGGLARHNTGDCDGGCRAMLLEMPAVEAWAPARAEIAA